LIFVQGERHESRQTSFLTKSTENFLFESCIK
jgi:hypothetical protein